MRSDKDQSRRKAYLPVQASDFSFSYKGREIGWLSKLLGMILAPIVRWRLRRGWRPRDREP